MLEICCPAKINLYLRVVGKREDGYHGLVTLFQEIDLADKLCWEPGTTACRLTVSGGDVGPRADNLVWRAIEAFKHESGLAVGGVFHLEKRIPAGAGLGGGSSDAAGALRMLNRYYDQPLTPEVLDRLALALGSDVPFFLRGGCCLGEGRGELLTPVTAPDCAKGGYLLLSGLHLSTVAVFKAYAGGVRPHDDRGGVLGENHLLAAALSVSGAFEDCWSGLLDVLAGEAVLMTGSGSSCVWLTESDSISAKRLESLAALGIRAVSFRFARAS